MIDPIAASPGIWQLRLPLAGNSLHDVNSYLIAGKDGCALVDCGWDTPDSLEALRAQLGSIGLSIDAIRTVVATHIHGDHYGMAGRIKKLAGARLLLHRLEHMFIESRFAHPAILIDEMVEWLRAHGVPDGELRAMADCSLPLLEKVHPAHPDQALEGGETIRLGDSDFEVVWTPGHTAGHVCLYNRESRVLLAGDHILGKISPNIGSHIQAFGTPLADYFTSLDLVGQLDVGLILPGHGKRFTGIVGRAAELVDHHRARLAEMAELVEQSEMTPYEVARKIRWSGRPGGWATMPTFHQRAAVGETIAHLEYLAGRGTIAKRHARGRVYYSAARRPPEAAGLLANRQTSR